MKSWLIGKDSDAGRDWGQEEKGTTEDEMARWHHGLDGCESEWTPGLVMDGGPGMLRFMGSQRVGHDWVTELNWTEDVEGLNCTGLNPSGGLRREIKSTPNKSNRNKKKKKLLFYKGEEYFSRKLLADKIKQNKWKCIYFNHPLKGC